MPAIHLQDLQKTYAKIAQGYQNKHAEIQEDEALDKFIKNIKPKGEILDLGAGVGTESRWLADRGFQVTMFDMSHEMLEIAKAKVPEAKVVQGDMTEMEFEPGVFDGVLARASLLHLTKAEAKKVITKVLEILKNGGVFLSTLKLGEGEEVVEDEKYGQKAKRFFAFYTQEEGEQLFREAGFKSVSSVLHQTPSGQMWVQVTGVK